MCLLQLLEDPASVRSREGSGHRDTQHRQRGPSSDGVHPPPCPCPASSPSLPRATEGRRRLQVGSGAQIPLQELAGKGTANNRGWTCSGPCPWGC